jgi:hypothetical protein
MARPKWLASLTQHGETPPAMLKFRSSDGFIIGTVALAVFTVSDPFNLPWKILSRKHIS